MARVTKTAWFGPKRWGWGWTPASWQGWMVTLAFGVIGQVLQNRLPPRRAMVATAVMVAAFMGVVVLTGDSPGTRRRTGPSSAENGSSASPYPALDGLE